MPFANWRMRKAGGIIQPKSQGLRTRGANDVNPSQKVREWGADSVNCSQSPKPQESGAPVSKGWDGCPSSNKERKFALPLHVCSVQAPSGLDDAHRHW